MIVHHRHFAFDARQGALHTGEALLEVVLHVVVYYDDAQFQFSDDVSAKHLLKVGTTKHMHNSKIMAR